MIQSIMYIFILIISYVLWNVYRNQKFGRNVKTNIPPGSFGWPLIGETLSLRRAALDGVPERFINERIEKHGSPMVFKTSVFGNRMAVLCGSAGNKFLFANENKLVAVWWPPQLRELIGKSLFKIHGDEAKWTRKVIMAYLGPDAFVNHYGATMDVVTRQHIEMHWKGKEEVNVFQTVKLYTFELVCRVFMSLKEPDHIAKLGALFNIFLKGLFVLPINLPGTRFYRAIKATSMIRTELTEVIKARRVALAQGDASSSQDLLSHLLTSSDENGRCFTDMEIVNLILALLFAGHESTTVTIVFLMKRLSEHPHVYDKVLKEQLEICNAKEPGELLKLEDLRKMRYSSSVLSEVWRLIPPGFGGFREALVDFEYGGYTIPKGWKLHWSASSTHKDEANFEDPTRFDPSRFEGATPSPFTFLPFGGGPRMCLGNEFSRFDILVFLHNIITNFKWDLLIPNEKIYWDPLATPSKGLPIRLHPHQV
ncbi:hypothetical protein QVD17_40464 [Tagetes erecta]|uniref:Cytochrome P450 n=1 Tax=Tagetes erecta TaxID=13708 RepID=A0AAD8NG53_TARER|nr:hypothetical protein QVD17_40464 [Tagetes erecta]